MIERRFQRNLRSLESIVGFVNEFLGAQCAQDTPWPGADAAYDVHLMIEELFTNMVKYGGASREDIEIGLAWEAPWLTVRLRDFDVERFDVTQAPRADLRQPVEQRRQGGLGLHFVQRVADGLAYEWVDRVSTITITKRLGR